VNDQVPGAGVRVALVGGRRSTLTALDAALRGPAFDTLVVPTASSSALDELVAVVAQEPFHVLVFDRSVDDAACRRVLDAARSRNPRVGRVDPLIAGVEPVRAQVELAARHALGRTEGDPAVVVEAVPDPAVVVRTSSVDVEVVRHQASAWGRPRSTSMTVEREGSDAVAFFPRQPNPRRDVVSVRVDGECVFVGASLGRLPLCR
jgi:hypothetical protein